MDTLTRKRDGTESFEEDALREILAIERQAQGVIKDAEAESQRIVATAQQQAQELRMTTEVETKRRNEAALRAAASAVEQELQATQEQAAREAQDWKQSAEAHLDAALAYVLRVITLGEGR